MGTCRENVVSGNLIIIWKLNEAWPLKKNSYGHKENSTTALRLLKFLILKKGLRCFLTTLKVFNPEKDTITVLGFLIQKKDSITFLGLLKFLILMKGIHHFLETRKGFNFEKWLRHILITRKVYPNSYL